MKSFNGIHSMNVNKFIALYLNWPKHFLCTSIKKILIYYSLPLKTYLTKIIKSLFLFFYVGASKSLFHSAPKDVLNHMLSLNV